MRESICTQCHVNNLARRTESFWVFSPNNISNIKQSNFDLHFVKTENCLSFKLDFDRPWSSKCLPVAECLCSPMRWCKCRVIPEIICVAQITLKFIDHPLIVYNGGLLLFRGENLADLLRLKDRLDLDSNFCGQILHFSFY